MERIQCVNVSLIKPVPGLGEKTIVSHVNSEFIAANISLITGATGAGKSALIHILAGLIRPTEGEVLVDGQKVSRWISGHRDRWRQNLGIIFQQPHLLNGLTVLENVCLPLIPRKMALDTIRKKGCQALDCFNLEPMAGERVMTLSGGERQRVAAARAIVSDPDIILADEPTAHQDMENVIRIMDVFERFKRKKAVIIITSHDSRLVESDWFNVRFDMENGRVEKVR